MRFNVIIYREGRRAIGSLPAVTSPRWNGVEEFVTILRLATIRRLLASVALAGMAVSLATPSLLAGATGALDCPLAPGSAPEPSVWL